MNKNYIFLSIVHNHAFNDTFDLKHDKNYMFFILLFLKFKIIKQDNYRPYYLNGI